MNQKRMASSSGTFKLQLLGFVYVSVDTCDFWYGVTVNGTARYRKQTTSVAIV